MENKVDILNTVTVRKILTSKFKKPKTKIQPKALELITKILNIAVVECSLRSGKQAYAEDSNTVTSDIVQKILPQLASSFLLHKCIFCSLIIKLKSMYFIQRSIMQNYLLQLMCNSFTLQLPGHSCSTIFQSEVRIYPALLAFR